MKTVLLTCLFLSLMIDNSLGVLSVAFEEGKDIPKKYTCEGDNVNPPISIAKLPANTQSLALIVYDVDAPDGEFFHWVMWNIPVSGVINENSEPGTVGVNSKKQNRYIGPCKANSIHHYHFKAYALDISLELAKTSGAKELEKAMEGHVLATGDLIGQFKSGQE
jgi:Raf kinase inhibitor-like YbhB/YbcL family protein